MYTNHSRHLESSADKVVNLISPLKSDAEISELKKNFFRWVNTVDFDKCNANLKLLRMWLIVKVVFEYIQLKITVMVIGARQKC